MRVLPTATCEWFGSVSIVRCLVWDAPRQSIDAAGYRSQQ